MPESWTNKDFKEHDVELVFDVEIDSTDVNTADIIRKKLQDFGGDSEGHRLSNRTDNEVLANQRDIRQQIYKYIFRKRQDVKPIKVTINSIHVFWRFFLSNENFLCSDFFLKFWKFKYY